MIGSKIKQILSSGGAAFLNMQYKLFDFHLIVDTKSFSQLLIYTYVLFSFKRFAESVSKCINANFHKFYLVHS